MAYTEFLTQLQKDKIVVKLFTQNGTMLTGKIQSFDSECVVLDKCMILKAQIISIVPQ